MQHHRVITLHKDADTLIIIIIYIIITTIIIM